MKYDSFEGPVEELVLIKIREIEQKENIKILHVIESGSRAWGFASPDSDYDVRFIYVRNKKRYLGLRDEKDYIDWEFLCIRNWNEKMNVPLNAVHLTKEDAEKLMEAKKAGNKEEVEKLIEAIKSANRE